MKTKKGMAEGELLQRVEQVLAKASEPLLAREIAAELKRQGLVVERSTVNQVLYRNVESTFVKRDDHRWSVVANRQTQGSLREGLEIAAVIAPTVELHLCSNRYRAFLQEKVSVGRDPSCDVVLDDPLVSRRHLEIQVGEYGTSIADCNSSNGTYYQDGRVGTMLIAPGRVYFLALGGIGGVTVGISTTVPLRGPAGHNSRTWSVDQFAFSRPVVSNLAGVRTLSPRVVDAASTQAVLDVVPKPPVAKGDGSSPVVHADLFVVGVPAEHRSYKMCKASIRIGRSRSCDIVLPEVCEDVSAQHAELRWDGQQLWVVDLGSTNGTYVEGEQVEWRPIAAKGRSTLRLGHSGAGLVIRYVLGDHSTPQPRHRAPPSPPIARVRRDTWVKPSAISPELPTRRAATVPDEPRTVAGSIGAGDLGAEGTISHAVKCAGRWYLSGSKDCAAGVELGVIGIVGAGKSSLLNALLAPGCQLLPAGGVGSLTALPIRVVAATEPLLSVSYRGRAWLVDAVRSLRRPRGLSQDTLGGLSLLCTGDQHAVRDPEWLTVALRHALNPEVGHPPDETAETRAALARLSALLATNVEKRLWRAVQNTTDFFFAVREHTAGQLSPFCASIEVGWPSPLLVSGATIVDLPGMGSSHDAYATATIDWLSGARAVLVVCDRAGLTDTIVRALRSSGFIASWAEGTAQLMIGVTKLDLVVDDEVRAQPGLRWTAAFEAVAARAVGLVRSQLVAAFPDAVGRGATAPICPVTARELQRLAQDDPDDPSLLVEPALTGFPFLHSQVLSLLGDPERDRRSEVTSLPLIRSKEAATEPLSDVRRESLTGTEPNMSGLDGVDETIGRWEEWLQREGRPFFERREPARLPVLKQLIAEVRATSSPGRRELPICLLGNAGVGKSTLINALIDPLMLIVPQGGVGPLTAQATVVRFAKNPDMRATYHGARRLNQLVFALDRYCERQLRAARPDENEIDAVSRQEALLAFASVDEASAVERDAVEQRLRSYISQARQMVRGVQFGDDAIDEVAYLTDGIREALGRAPVWGHSVRDEDRERVQLLREAVSIGNEGRYLQGSGDRAGFLREVRRHATGSISPLIKSLDVGWDSELLRGGVVLVDLPGVGLANDEYRSVTSDWIRRATAVLLVVDRAGVTEPAAELLRTTGFLNALLHRAPETREVVPLLWVVSVKLDDVAKDERISFKQQHPDEKIPSWQWFFDEACAKVRVLVRNQLASEFAKLQDDDEMGEARSQAHRHVLEQLQVHPVSAIEYRKLMAGDDDDRALIKEASQSNVPALVASLREIAKRHSDEISQRVTGSLAELSASVQRGLRAVLDDLEQGDRDQVRLATLRVQLADVLAPCSREIALRQGQLRERLRGTIPQTIESEVARAVQVAAPAVAAYLKGIESVHWSTLRAAVRRGGIRLGNRPLDIPNELALRIEGPLAVIWNNVVVKAASDALHAFARDLERILDEVMTWAQSEEADLDATRVVRYRDDVVLRLKQLATITETAAESLRVDVKQRLYETVQETIRSECQAFVDAGRDIGSGVKSRVHAFLAQAGSVAREQAGEVAQKHLLETYERVVSGIGSQFASLSNVLADVEGIFLGHFHAVSAEDVARVREEARAVRAMLDDFRRSFPAERGA